MLTTTLGPPPSRLNVLFINRLFLPDQTSAQCRVKEALTRHCTDAGQIVLDNRMLYCSIPIKRHHNAVPMLQTLAQHCAGFGPMFLYICELTRFILVIILNNGSLTGQQSGGSRTTIRSVEV